MNFGIQLNHDDGIKIACIECSAQIGEYCHIEMTDDEKVRNPDPPTHRIRFSSLTSAMIIEEYLTNAHSVTRA